MRKTSSRFDIIFMKINIVIRNGKILLKVVWFEYYLLMNEDTSEFSKIIVPRLPQNTSNVNIESTGKLKQLYYLF